MKDVGPIVLAVAIFAALSLLAGTASSGFLEADSCTHYLYARFAFQQPHYFVNIWGRPICTGLYAIPAALGGRAGVHLMSLLLAIGCGLVAYAIARQQNYRWPALALIFTLAQPLLFLHSFSELTELPFALLLGLAFLAYLKRQFLWMAILIGLSPLGRPEGFGFVLLVALALIAHRRWLWLPLLVIPLIGWDYAGWIMYGRSGPWWRWLADNWPYAHSLYQHGNISHFAVLMPAIVSPLIFPAMCIGVWQSLRLLLPLPSGEGWGEGVRDDQSVSLFPRPLTLTLSQRERGQILIAVIPLMILVGHSVLYAAGKMASSGEIRYMLIVAPFWALLSASGWEWIFTRMNLPSPLRMAGIAALLPGLLNLTYRVLPLREDTDSLSARHAATWYRTSGIAADFPRLAAANPAIFFFLDTPPTGSNVVEWKKQNLLKPTSGTVVLWDPILSIYNSDAGRKVPLEDLLDAGWIDATNRAPEFGAGWRVLLSPRDIHERAADGPAPPRSPSPP